MNMRLSAMHVVTITLHLLPRHSKCLLYHLMSWTPQKIRKSWSLTNRDDGLIQPKTLDTCPLQVATKASVKLPTRSPGKSQVPLESTFRSKCNSPQAKLRSICGSLLSQALNNLGMIYDCHDSHKVLTLCRLNTL